MALKGIKVLELAGLAPGPFCGMVLRDFGATVTVIERKTKTFQPVLHEGKHRIGIDLKHPLGQDIVQKFSKQSDVLLEVHRPGVMERLQLGPDRLLADNPRLIYARLTGFGQTGPLSLKAGHDINYVAMSGILSLLGRKTEKPTPPINLLADFAGGGLLCAFGILAALIERNQSGKGQIIDSSMTEGASYMGSWLTRSQLTPRWGNERGNNWLDGGRFFYDTYETKDGKFMSVGAIEPKFYKAFLSGLGLRGVEQFEDNENSVELVSKIFKTRTQQEWTEIFSTLDACVYPVLDLDNANEHPHNMERKLFVDKNLTDEIVVPTPSPKLSRTPAKSGFIDDEQFNENELKKMFYEIGYDDGDLTKLKDEGVLDIN